MEQFTFEKFNVLLELLKIREKSAVSARDISRKTNLSVFQFSKFKKWLLEKSFMTFQGKVKNDTGSKTFEIEYFMVNHKEIDKIIFNEWSKTRILFARAHEHYPDENFQY